MHHAAGLGEGGGAGGRAVLTGDAGEPLVVGHALFPTAWRTQINNEDTLKYKNNNKVIA